MSTSLKSLFCLLACLFASVCLAEPPSGLVTFSFDSTNTPVWDLSGGLTFDQDMQGAGDVNTPVAFSVDVVQDTKGKLSGSGFTILNVGNDFVAAQYSVKGKVSGGGNSVNRASFTVKLSGEDVIAGVTTKFTGSIRYELTANASARTFSGTARGSLKFSGLSSATIRDEVTLTLNPAMDGSWTVQMNIVTLNKLGGSGSIILSNGRALPMQLSGSYSTSSGTSKIKLKGINEAVGTSLSLKFFNVPDEGFVIESMSGKILGQSVRQ
jgi:hypothetical protein